MGLQGYVYVGKELIDKVTKITDVNYEAKGDMLDMAGIITMIEDLVWQYEETKYNLEEEIDNLEQQWEYHNERDE